MWSVAEFGPGQISQPHAEAEPLLRCGDVSGLRGIAAIELE